jgi:hypothetical protein
VEDDHGAVGGAAHIQLHHVCAVRQRVRERRQRVLGHALEPRAAVRDAAHAPERGRERAAAAAAVAAAVQPARQRSGQPR